MAKVKIVSHHVRGSVATLVVAVPANGKLTVSGPGVKSSSRQVSRAERVTVHVQLTRAGVASLNRHHDRAVIKLKAAFKGVATGSSTATAAVTFK